MREPLLVAALIVAYFLQGCASPDGPVVSESCYCIQECEVR